DDVRHPNGIVPDTIDTVLRIFPLEPECASREVVKRNRTKPVPMVAGGHKDWHASPIAAALCRKSQRGINEVSLEGLETHHHDVCAAPRIVGVQSSGCVIGRECYVRETRAESSLRRRLANAQRQPTTCERGSRNSQPVVSN